MYFPYLYPSPPLCLLSILRFQGKLLEQVLPRRLLFATQLTAGRVGGVDSLTAANLSQDLGDDKLLEQTFPRRLLVAVNLSQILCHGLVMTSIPVKPDPDTRGFEKCPL